MTIKITKHGREIVEITKKHYPQTYKKLEEIISNIKGERSEEIQEIKKVIIWCGGEYTLKEGETIDSVMKEYNKDELDLYLDLTKITDLEGNTLKEDKI